MLSPRRSNGSSSPLIGLPGEEDRCLPENLLLLQNTVSRRSRTSSARSSLVNPSSRTPRSSSSWRSQFRKRLLRTTDSSASCRGVRALARNNRTASILNSAGYGGLVLGITHAPLPSHLARKHRGVNETGSTPGFCRRQCLALSLWVASRWPDRERGRRTCKPRRVTGAHERAASARWQHRLSSTVAWWSAGGAWMSTLRDGDRVTSSPLGRVR